MSKLSVLLWIDDEFHSQQPDAIDTSIGDKYLMAMNPIFARMRRCTLDLGGRFSSEANPQWMDYQSAALFCLGEILHHGVIPYIPNGDTLRRIICRTPTVQVSDGLLLEIVRKNVVLHESAHFCCDRLLARVSGPSRDKADFVVRCLIAESFANLIEFTASAFADYKIHRLFFAMNSYVLTSSTTVSILRTLILTVGFRQVLTLGMLTYLFLNAHDIEVGSDFTDKVIERVLHKQRLSIAETQIARLLVETGFTLSYKFRAETTPLFFSLYDSMDEYRAFGKTFTNPFDLEIEVISMIDALVDSVFPHANEPELMRALEDKTQN